MRLYERRYKYNQPFCGIDGEGANIRDTDALFGADHRYLLLRAGEFKLENAEGITFKDSANFLCDLPRDRIYVGYFFDYDVTMMLKMLPQDRAERIFDRAARHHKGYGSPLPVQFGGFDFDYLPHKEYRIRRTNSSHWTIVSDVGQFFQTGFLKTLEKWGIGTSDEREMIRRGKSMRADFTGLTDEIRAYNALEILLLEQLMSEFRAVCIETGYIPKKWQGPGYLASAMLDAHKVPRRKNIPILDDHDFRGLANDAYYGGRFETTATGPILGPVYQYDINSAYPSVLRSLPCLIHGTWRRIRDMPDNGLWFGQVHFNHTSRQLLYNLPVRTKDGNIYYPREGNGVYWSTEIYAAKRAGLTPHFNGGWAYEHNCVCGIFDFVDDYYRKRLALGKTTKGYVLKLAGNSIYGKLAQSIGYAPFANPVWAGLITAGCRAQIIDAYSQAVESTYMIATDGLFVGRELDLPVSKKLGEWEVTEHKDGIFIVQPGIYYPSGGEVKTRGVERGRISQRREDFSAAWDKFLASHGEDHTVSVAVDNFITARQALVRRKWNIAGTWEHATRDIGFDWRTKRVGANAVNDGRALRTLPYEGSPTLISFGYPQQIGGHTITSLVRQLERYTDPGLQEKERMAEQPDWVEPLISE